MRGIQKENTAPPVLSVVVPVYNVEKYLPECLDSICGQTLKDIEIICVDDGSADNSVKILTGYAQKDPRLKIISTSHVNAGHARNAGLDAATGIYVGFLDSDDVYDPGMLKALYDNCEQHHAEIGVVGHSDFSEALHAPFPPAEEAAFRIMEEPIKNTDVFTRFVGWPWDKIFRRDFIISQGLRYQEQYATNDLFFVYAALTLASRIVVTDVPYAHHRKRSDSIEATRWKDPFCFIDAITKYYDIFKHKMEKDPFWLRIFSNYILLFCSWHVRTLDKEFYPDLSAKIKKLAEDIGLVDLPADYLIDHDWFYQYMTIMGKEYYNDTTLLLFRQRADLRNELRCCREDFQHSQSELAQTHDDLQKTRDELQKKQDELHSFQDELQCCREDFQHSQSELSRIREEFHFAQDELLSLKNSISYIIGRKITWPLRMIRNFFKRGELKKRSQRVRLQH